MAVANPDGRQLEGPADDPAGAKLHDGQQPQDQEEERQGPLPSGHLRAGGHGALSTGRGASQDEGGVEKRS